MKVSLFDGAAVNVSLLRHERNFPGYDVWHGRAEEDRISELPEFTNAIFVVNRSTGTLTATIETERGVYAIRPEANRATSSDSPPAHRMSELESWSLERNCNVGAQAELDDPELANETEQAAGEQDACGTYIFDVYMAYTESAADVVGDIQANALALVASANSGLLNSRIRDVKLRLVGAGTTPWEPTGTGFDALGEALRAGLDSVAAEVTRTGADFSGMVIGTESGSGLAYVPGWRSAVGPGANAWRHEWGHNAGSSHCPENGGGVTAYGHGWNAGASRYRTHMCGNSFNIYSTPLVTVDGYTLGNPAQADNTRLINERKALMAGHVAHVIPFPDCGSGGTGGSAGAGGTGATAGSGGKAGTGGAGAGGTGGGSAGSGGVVGSGGAGASAGTTGTGSGGGSGSAGSGGAGASAGTAGSGGGSGVSGSAGATGSGGASAGGAGGIGGKGAAGGSAGRGAGGTDRAGPGPAFEEDEGSCACRAVAMKRRAQAPGLVLAGLALAGGLLRRRRKISTRN